MKKVNKQCLLDPPPPPPPPPPRTVRVSEKTWHVIVQTSIADLSFEKKILVETVQTKIIFSQTNLLHAYVQCVYIVSAKYRIAPSKALVGVDQPMQALSMHIQKPYKNNCLSSHSCHFVKKKKLLHAYVQYVYIV